MRLDLGPDGIVMQLIQFGIDAFSKKRKVRKVLEAMQTIGTSYDDFISAREKIDEAEAEGVGCTLTADEVDALDFMMDRFARTAKRLKRAIDTERL